MVRSKRKHSIVKSRPAESTILRNTVRFGLDYNGEHKTSIDIAMEMLLSAIDGD